MTFRHKTVFGYTGTGKTTLAKERVITYLKHHQSVIVFPGTGDTDWPKGVKFFWDADTLEEALQDPANFQSFIVLDECAVLYEEVTRKNHPYLHGLFMRGRHDGYTVWALTQYTTSIPRKVRLNCTERYIFGTADEDDAMKIWKDCNKISYEGVPLWQAIMNLNRFEYFRYIHPNQISKHITRKLSFK